MPRKRQRNGQSATNAKLKQMKIQTALDHLAKRERRARRRKHLSPRQVSDLRLRVGLQAVLSQPGYADAIEPYRA